ncbi:glycosyl transferase family 39 [Gloeothece citriformis PCC 7424]|uniref:Glycosyl transferase family 39 n=1 Tax=Gloeothece citriformis (strain PCC 7424) TaxID=65393 RepID=B7KDP4_GLOC7|nr:glycosyltransferase family 39 protein [Gloeothece citriformis]ACK70346.1 glycosyl transferase family 39 [Gloeothece citriformis PCC 7424]
MQKLLLSWFKPIIPYQDWLFCGLITILGIVLRLHNYDTLPPDNWTADEYAFAWSGMSLIQDHVPTGWSWLTPTDDFPTVYWEEKGSRYRIVSPWFDHPPLYSLIVGMTSILGGAKDFFDCSLTVMRIPSLVMGISAIILFYSLCKKLFNTNIAVISSLIFATNPNTVFLSRLALSENLILLLSLGVILLFLQYNQTSKSIYLYSSAILAGLAILVKVTGIFLICFLIVVLIYQRKWIDSLIVLLIGLVGFSLYYLYGWIYDFEFFKKILEEQTNRFTDFGILKYLILPTVFFEDGWLCFSWLTLIPVLKLTEKLKSQIIALPILIYSLLLVSSGAQSHYFAWYTIPFYPFLFLSLGIFLADFWKKPDFMSACLIFLFLGVWNIHLNIGDWILSSSKGEYYFILATGLVLLVYLLDEITKRKTERLTCITTILAFSSLIIANINVILTYKP